MSFHRSLLALLFGALAFVAVDHDIPSHGAAIDAEVPDAPATGAQLLASTWTLGCKPDSSTKELLCEASQTIAVEQTRQTLLIAFVTPWTDEDGSYVLRFQLPHGLDIPAGVELQIDDVPVQSPVIQTSNQIGVFARTALADPLLAAMKKGATMQVAFSALNGTKLTVPVSLEGFSAIFDKLQ